MKSQKIVKSPVVKLLYITYSRFTFCPFDRIFAWPFSKKSNPDVKKVKLFAKKSTY